MKVGNRKYEPHYDSRHGFYFIHLQVDGKRKYFGLGTNQKEAEKKLADLLRKKAAGALFTDSTSTVQIHDGKKRIAIEELAHRHLEWCETQKSKATYEMRKNFIKLFLHYLKDVRTDRMFWVTDLTLLVFEEYLSWVKKNRAKSKRGGIDHLRHIKTMLRWGYERDLCDLPRRFPKIKAAEPKTKHFSNGDLPLLLAAAPDDLRSLLKFGVATGLRPLELRGLRREQIEQNADGTWSVHIPEHKTADSSKTYEPRDVPLTEEAHQIVERELAKHPDSPFVFLNGDGKPYSTHSLDTRLKRCCRRAGIESKSVYSMRHTFAVVLAGSGVNLALIKELMGHSNISTTTRYTKHNEEYHRQAVQFVADHCARLQNGEGGKTEKTDRVTDRGARRKKGSPQDKDTTA